MGYTWAINDLPVGDAYRWDTHGSSLGHHWKSKDYQGVSHGVHMWRPCGTYRLHTGWLWATHGLPLRATHVVTIGCPWVNYGVRTVHWPLLGYHYSRNPWSTMGDPWPTRG